MPYVIAKQDEGFCVFKQGPDDKPEGKTLGCHPTEEKAQEQLKALYANVPDAHGLQAFYTRGVCQRAAGAVDGSPLRFILTTEGVKRDGLDIDPAGWQFDNYRRNPIVTWAHDMMGARLPIGRAEVDTSAGAPMADVWFDQEDPFARQIESKYRRGFLHAVSVSWDTKERTGNRVSQAELLEIACVPVPGDPDALIVRQSGALRAMLTDLTPSVTQPGPEEPLQDVDLLGMLTRMNLTLLEVFNARQ